MIFPRLSSSRTSSADIRRWNIWRKACMRNLRRLNGGYRFALINDLVRSCIFCLPGSLIKHVMHAHSPTNRLRSPGKAGPVSSGRRGHRGRAQGYPPTTARSTAASGAGRKTRTRPASAGSPRKNPHAISVPTPAPRYLPAGHPPVRTPRRGDRRARPGGRPRSPRRAGPAGCRRSAGTPATRR